MSKEPSIINQTNDKKSEKVSKKKLAINDGTTIDNLDTKIEKVHKNKQLTKSETKTNDLDKKTKDVTENKQLSKSRTKTDDLEKKTKDVNENKQLTNSETISDHLDNKTKDVSENKQLINSGTKNDDLEIITKNESENKQLTKSGTKNDDLDIKTKRVSKNKQLTKSGTKNDDLEKKTKDVNENKQLTNSETISDHLDNKTKDVNENKQLTKSGTKNDDLDIKTKRVSKNKRLTKSGTKTDDVDKKTKDVNENKQLSKSGTKDVSKCEPETNFNDLYMIIGKIFTDDSIKACLSKEVDQRSKSLCKSGDLDKKIKPVQTNKQISESLSKYIRWILVIVHSFFYIIIGLCLLLVGIYLCFMKVENMNSMKICYFIISTGCFIILTGACGSYERFRNYTYILGIFIFYMLLTFLFVLCVIGTLYWKEFHCCGLYRPSDYSKDSRHIIDFTNGSNKYECQTKIVEFFKKNLMIFLEIWR